MKKLICIVMMVCMLTGCRPQAPRVYDFYNDFAKENVNKISAESTDGYNNIAKEENLAVLKSKVGMENLIDHEIYSKKGAIIVNLYFDRNADHRQIDKAREYARETFWEGKLHTADILPYEDWQYSHQIKRLCVQIFNHEQVVLVDRYAFDQLTSSGEKKYTLDTEENTDIVFFGTYIALKDYLKGTQEQLDSYVDIDDIAGVHVYTSIHQTLCKDRMYVMLLTDEGQIDPQRLTDIYNAVYERYSFINENLYVQLCVADQPIYYEYNGPVEVPAEE